MSADTNRDREAREILRGIADEREIHWLGLIEPLLNAPTTAERLREIQGASFGALPRPPSGQLTQRCHALLDAVRRARAGGAA